jgi:kynurenine formamidase
LIQVTLLLHEWTPQHFVITSDLAHTTASLDRGKSRDFAVHCILLGAGIYGIENVNGNIDQLPASGFTLIVMPMKIGGGSGAPARVVATIPC